MFCRRARVHTMWDTGTAQESWLPLRRSWSWRPSHALDGTVCASLSRQVDSTGVRIRVRQQPRCFMSHMQKGTRLHLCLNVVNKKDKSNSPQTHTTVSLLTSKKERQINWMSETNMNKINSENFVWNPLYSFSWPLHKQWQNDVVCV